MVLYYYTLTVAVTVRIYKASTPFSSCQLPSTTNSIYNLLHCPQHNVETQGRLLDGISPEEQASEDQSSSTEARDTNTLSAFEFRRLTSTAIFEESAT